MFTKEDVNRFRADFQHYAETVLRISTKDARIIAFKFKPFQIRLWKILEQRIAEGVPIRWVILKARQLGCSTFFEGFIYWRISLNKATNALVVAHKLDSAEHILEMEQLFYDHSPHELKPTKQKSNRKEIRFANPNPKPGETPGLNSGVLIGTAKDEDLGASFTLHIAHLSEFARWDRVSGDLQQTLASMINTMAYVPGTAVFIESTAQGHNFFKKLWDDKKNLYEKIFISWLADDEYRIDITPEEYFKLQVADDSQYGDELSEVDNIERELKFWHPELDEDKMQHEVYCRLAWRRHMIDNNFFGNVMLFKQEYPTTPDDAFLAKGSKVFDAYALDDLRKEAEVSKSRTFSFDNLVLEDRKQQKRFWWKNALVENVRGEFVVYEAPKPHANYVMGVDPSDGIGDPIGCKVFRIDAPNLIEVVDYSVKSVTPDDLAYHIYCLGMLYNEAYMGIEANKPGAETIRILLKELYYGRLYYRETFDSTIKQRVNKPGWYTSASTKHFLINALASIIRERGIIIKTARTVEQLFQYRKEDSPDLDSNKARYGAPSGENDDDVIATAIACLIARDSKATMHSLTKPDPMSAAEVVRRNETRLYSAENFLYNRFGRGVPIYGYNR